MISTRRVYNKLAEQSEFICTVELAILLGANTSEVRQRLKELGNCVISNEHDEWQVTGKITSVVPISPLTASEIKEKEKLENTVQEAFYQAGLALKTLRDKKLYRETHTSFISYVRNRFGFTRRNADYLISASEVMDNLKREQIVLGINVLPTSESQCREIAKLPPEKQPSAWIASIEKANNKIPPARIIKEVVNKIKGEPKMFQNPKKDGLVRVPGIGIEYIVTLDEETYYKLQAYKEEIGAATNNGAIARLLNAQKQRNN